jgi:hypothetical protein
MRPKRGTIYYKQNILELRKLVQLKIGANDDGLIMVATTSGFRRRLSV